MTKIAILFSTYFCTYAHTFYFLFDVLSSGTDGMPVITISDKITDALKVYISCVLVRNVQKKR